MSSTDPTQRDNRPAVYEDNNGDVIYRASAIGYCTKMLAALRQEYESKPVPDSIRKKMDESSDLEDDAIDRYIADHHTTITTVEREVPHTVIKVKDGVYIKGKPDTAVGLNDGRKGIVEVKNLGPSLYKAATVSIPPTYLAQGTIYMVGYDFITYVLRNKQTGEMYYKTYNTTPTDLGALFRKVLHVEALALELELPDTCDRVQYPCPVFYLHEQDIFEPWEDISLQHDFEELVRAYSEAHAMEKKGKEAKKAIQAELKGFRAQNIGLTDKKGQLETPLAKFTRSQFTVRKISETALEWFLAEHGKTLDEFKDENVVETWRATWRG